MLRKMLCCLLCCIAILCLTATSVFANNDLDGSDEIGMIHFDFSDGETPITGGSIQLRQIAVWHRDSWTYSWCEGYENCGMALKLKSITPDNAKRLFVFAETNRLPARTIEIGPDGAADVRDLEYGLYLVSQVEPFEGYLPMTPAFIHVPIQVNRELIYHVDAKPKIEPLIPETTVPSTTEPGIPDIPDTGQINWPIPVLLLAGSVLMILGLCLRKEKNHET